MTREKIKHPVGRQAVVRGFWGQAGPTRGPTLFRLSADGAAALLRTPCRSPGPSGPASTQLWPACPALPTAPPAWPCSGSPGSSQCLSPAPGTSGQAALAPLGPPSRIFSASRLPSSRVVENSCCAPDHPGGAGQDPQGALTMNPADMHVCPGAKGSRFLHPDSGAPTRA